MSEFVKELTAKDFEKSIEKGLWVIDFWAEWCGPCKMLSPLVEQIAKDMNGKVHFGKVDVDGNQELAEKFEVMSIPTLIYFKDGEQVNRTIGYIEREEIEKAIEESA